MKTLIFLLTISLLILPTAGTASGTAQLDRCLVLKTMIINSDVAPLPTMNTAAATLYGLNRDENLKKLWKAYGEDGCNSIFEKVLDDTELSSSLGLSKQE